MEQGAPAKVELIIAGIGGMGVLVAGRLLASAAVRSHRHISWMPSYGEARRGGPSECTVILSQDEIASPILDQAATMILLDGSQLKYFEGRMRPGGVMLVETAGLTEQPDRKDFRLVPVSGLEIAMGMGGVLVNSLIHLGAYVEALRPLPPGTIVEELESKYAGREAVLKLNKDAFAKGLELGRALEV